MNPQVNKLCDRVLLFALPVAILGSVFKTMHYPHSNQMLIAGLSSIAIASFLKYALEKTLDGYITGSAIALGCIAVLFKLEHWAQADLLIKLAVCAALVWGIRIFFPANKVDGE